MRTAYFSKIRLFAAHALKIIQGSTLSRKDHADIAGDRGQVLSPGDRIAFRNVEGDLGSCIQQFEDSGEDLQTADHAVFLADQIGRSRTAPGHDAVGRNIFTGDVFF